MHCIVYTSEATRPFEPEELQALLSRWRLTNHCRGISGVLLYANDGRILQVLEGEQTTVEDMFHRIHRDCRHFEVTKLCDGAVTDRSFAGWSMSFCLVPGTLITQLSGYFSPRHNNPMLADGDVSSVALQALLNEFMATMALPAPPLTLLHSSIS